MQRRTVVWILASLVAAACNESPTEPPDSLSLEFRTVFKGITTQAGPPRREVIRDASRWQHVWRELWIQTPNDSLPEVDFTRQMVVLSTRGGGVCDETLIENIVLAEDLVVSVHDRVIDQTQCGCVSVAGNPVHAVATSRVFTEAAFVIRNTVSCEPL